MAAPQLIRLASRRITDLPGETPRAVMPLHSSHSPTNLYAYRTEAQNAYRVERDEHI
jgi:hypothetical protein